MTDPPPQLYAKHLLPFGYGYPLWTPEPSHELLVRRRDGLRIGDVGVIDLENGSFDVFFNICLPRDHPLHEATGVPDGFVPVKLDPWDIASFPHAESPGRVISTSSVMASSVEPSGGSTSRPFTYEFSLSASEGALLILPKGAESYKLRKRQLFRDVAARNAVCWYEFAQRHLGRIIAPDALYLITGLCKTGAWSVAAFHQATGTGTGTAAESSAQFKASALSSTQRTGVGWEGGGGAGDGNMSYTWETTRALDWRVGPRIDVGIPNQSVFVSGFKIAVREGVLGKPRVQVEVDAPLARRSWPAVTRRFSNGNGGSGSDVSRVGSIWKRFLSGGGKKAAEPTSSATRSQKERERRTTFSSTLQSGDKGATEQVAVDHVPQALQSLHPSDVVNRYLLSKEPSANVAITHDSQWSALFEKGALKSEDVVLDGQLERAVSESCRVVSREGVVYFQTACDSSVRLMGVEDTAHVAWKEDKLDDAEEILSGQLIRHTGSDYSTLAHRALIRARLHHWDAALRDAETSIDIQPSVIAQVAKGFALFGQGKYELAVEAFNVALWQCDVHDKDVVLLIKSIVLFEVGYHAESMADLTDLIKRCPKDAKSACSIVQAEMYVRLATPAAKNGNHDRALQLLTRAQSLGPLVHAVPDLNTISLICGWKFDNLLFTIHRHRCDALLLLGRTNEALESFRTMTRELGEDARMKKDNAEWIAAFTQQCLRVLEGLGDSAMTSKNYAEAISRYSMALSIDPVTREGILIKRSKAYTATHVWDDALRDAEEAINLNPVSSSGYERKREALRGMNRYDETVRTATDMLSVLERSTDPQHLGTRDSSPLQSVPAIETSDPPTFATVSHPSRHSPDLGIATESAVSYVQRPDQHSPDVVRLGRAEAPETSQHVEQHHSAQLGRLVAHLSSIREQLDSDVADVERDRVLRNQLSDALNTIMPFLHERATGKPREDDRSQATGTTGDQVPIVVIEDARGHVTGQDGRYSPMHTSTRVSRPTPSPTIVDVRSGRSFVPEAYHPADGAPPDEGRQLLRPMHPNDDRRSRSHSPYVPTPIPLSPSSPGPLHQVLRDRRDRDDNLLEYLRHHEANDDYVDRSEDTQIYQPRRHRSPLRRREDREQPRSPESNDEIIDTHSVQGPPVSLERDFSRTPSHTGQTAADLTSEGGLGTVSPDSRSDLENLISTWQHIVRRRESRRNVNAPNLRIQTGPMPVTADTQPRQRRRASSTDSSMYSTEEFDKRRNSSEAPTRSQAPHREMTAPLPTATNVHVQQPGFLAQPPTYAMMAPAPIFAQPQVALHDTMLEMLREQRLAHRASLDQQQELTRQTRNFCEWMMRDVQDRSAELRGIAAKLHPYPPRPWEPGPTHLPFQHSGIGMPPPVAPIPMASTPWSLWYPPPLAPVNATPFSSSSFGGGPFNVTPYASEPFIPSPPQHAPYIPPDHIVREFGSPNVNIPRGSAPKGHNVYGVVPSVDPPPSNHPRKTPPPPAMILPPPALTSAATSKPQTEANALAAAPKSLLLGSESGSPTAPGTTVVGSPTDTSPFSTLATRLKVPGYDDSPRKSTSGGAGDDGDKTSAKSGPGEKRRPGMVTFGEVTYI